MQQAEQRLVQDDALLCHVRVPFGHSLGHCAGIQAGQGRERTPMVVLFPCRVLESLAFFRDLPVCPQKSFQIDAMDCCLLE